MAPCSPKQKTRAWVIFGLLCYLALLRDAKKIITCVRVIKVVTIATGFLSFSFLTVI